MSETTGSTDTMKICLGVLREIEVDYDINGLDIDTTGEEIGTDKIAADTVAEIVENAVAIRLEHASMAVEAGVAKFCDLLGEKFNTVGGVAEDDRLVDLQFREKSVQAVNLLALFNEGVVLGDTAESEFVHEVDFERRIHILIGESLDGDGESRTEQHDLAILRVELEELFDNWRKFRGEEFISFVHDKCRTFAEIGNTLSCEVENSSWSTNNYMDRVL